jgi:membrane associated rhomboid family serine protease
VLASLAPARSYRRSHDLPYLSWRDFELAKTSSLRNNPPIFTYALGAICVSLMIWEFSVNDWVVEPMGVNPMAGVSAETLIECGARVTPLIITGQAWRLVTPLFLHSGIIHLVFNMMVLLFVGRGLEKAHGTAAAAGYFLIGGYGGNVLSALFLPQL